LKTKADQRSGIHEFRAVLGEVLEALRHDPQDKILYSTYQDCIDYLDKHPWSEARFEESELRQQSARHLCATRVRSTNFYLKAAAQTIQNSANERTRSVCKTFIHRFDSDRRLHLLPHYQSLQENLADGKPLLSVVRFVGQSDCSALQKDTERKGRRAITNSAFSPTGARAIFESSQSFLSRPRAVASPTSRWRERLTPGTIEEHRHKLSVS